MKCNPVLPAEITANDSVNHPKHYTSHPSGVEVIELTENLSFCAGNAVKYLARKDLKGNAVEDLRKALWYFERERNRIGPDAREELPIEIDDALEKFLKHEPFGNILHKVLAILDEGITWATLHACRDMVELEILKVTGKSVSTAVATGKE